ncbi:MAG: glycosyltransferase [Conexivisphaerales archaeon]
MRIIIVGRTKKYNAEYFYSKYFRRLGHDVEVVDMFLGVDHRLFESLVHSRTKLFRYTLDAFEINKYLTHYVEKSDPDAIVVFRGEMVSKKTLSNLIASYHVYLFYPDVFKFLRSISDRIYLYEALFTSANVFDPYLKLGCKHCYTIPWACDPEFHRSLNYLVKEYDSSFIGTAYPERRRILRNLSNVEVFGDFWYGFGKRSHKAVRGEEYIETINKTAVNLNLQTRASIVGDAPTMRTFEISGCGAFQISDSMPSIHRYFPKMTVFRDSKEIQDLISYYLDAKDERNEIALENQRICYSKFTYENTAKSILSKMHGGN